MAQVPANPTPATTPNTPDLEAAAERLAAARSRGAPDEVAEALAQHANALVNHGQLAQARLELDEVTEIYRHSGRQDERARYALLAATLCRLLRQLPAARERAQLAASLVAPGTPIAISIATELGDIALAEGNTLQAIRDLDRAIDGVEAAGLPAATRTSLLRKRATALTLAGRHDAAADDLEAAREIAATAGDQGAALRALVEEATALHQGRDPRAAQVRQQAVQAAQAAGNHGALADLALLEASASLDRRDGPAAMAAAQAARTHALAAAAPVPYLSAAIAIAEIADTAGDRAAAYEALAVGWVTLGDLVGREAARITFEPKLRVLREKWGAEAFAAVKAAYEARRRAEIAREQAGGNSDPPR